MWNDEIVESREVGYSSSREHVNCELAVSVVGEAAKGRGFETKMLTGRASALKPPQVFSKSSVQLKPNNKVGKWTLNWKSLDHRDKMSILDVGVCGQLSINYWLLTNKAIFLFRGKFFNFWSTFLKIANFRKFSGIQYKVCFSFLSNGKLWAYDYMYFSAKMIWGWFYEQKKTLEFRKALDNLTKIPLWNIPSVMLHCYSRFCQHGLIFIQN